MTARNAKGVKKCPECGAELKVHTGVAEICSKVQFDERGNVKNDSECTYNKPLR
jgi:predicted amidophosphoribosyltransferase